MRRLDRLPILQLRDPLGGDLTLWIADSYRSRLAGLGSIKRLDSDRGMLIPGCRSVHTAGMRLAIDVLFARPLGGDFNALEVLLVRERVVSWRVASLIGTARRPVAIELRAGRAQAGKISAGSRLYGL